MSFSTLKKRMIPRIISREVVSSRPKSRNASGIRGRKASPARPPTAKLTRISNALCSRSRSAARKKMPTNDNRLTSPTLTIVQIQTIASSSIEDSTDYTLAEHSGQIRPGIPTLPKHNQGTDGCLWGARASREDFLPD
ncbi:MAG: hypothetical protein MUC88_16665 [Planctomycetes bacterium]|nr:hypothetical protein [Planctomycetota bacterium]